MSTALVRALLKRHEPDVLAKRARELIEREAAKGCEPAIAPMPVELESPFILLGHDTPLPGQEHVTWLPAAPHVASSWRRVQVWISPEQHCDWTRCERFLKQVSRVRHRVGLELVGNSERVDQLLLFHASDAALMRAAFYGEFERCELTVANRPPHVQTTEMPSSALRLRDFYPSPPYSHILTRPSELRESIYGTIVSALGTLPPEAIGLYQVLFQPVLPEHNWHHNVQRLIDLEYELKQVVNWRTATAHSHHPPSGYISHMANDADTKAHDDRPFFFASVRAAVSAIGSCDSDHIHALCAFAGMIQQGGRPLRCLDEADYRQILAEPQLGQMLATAETYRPGFLVNSEELSTLAHFTAPKTTKFRRRPLEPLEHLSASSGLADGVQIGFCDHAGSRLPICLSADVRGKHLHLIGRPGSGKSTLMENMILQETAMGHGVALLDPHGSLINRLLCFLPGDQVDRVIYINPGDREQVPIWNPLHCGANQDPSRITGNLVNTFRSIVDGWGDRLAHLLRHAIFALLHLPGASLRDVNDLLRKGSPASRELIGLLTTDKLSNEVSRRFWLEDFPGYGKDEVRPPQHKLSKLLLSGTVSLMLSQPDSAFNLRKVMDDGNILLVDLSDLGTDTCDMLGCFMLALLRETAIARRESSGAKLRPFHIYCDEAHRFLTDAVGRVIAEARKFSVSLTLAHQFMSQFGAKQAGALSGVASTVIFNINKEDASYLKKDLLGRVDEEDLITLEVGQAIARITTAKQTEVIRLRTLPWREPPGDDHRQTIIAQSRQRYYKPIDEVQRIVSQRSDRWQRAAEVASSPPESVQEPGYDEF